MSQARFTSLELCAGVGGQALGLERAGFDPVALVEVDRHACGTLRANRRHWNVLETDLLDFDPYDHPYVHDVDLVAAGLPRVRSNASVARVDGDHELALLKATIWLVHGVRPRAVLIENVPELAKAEPYAEIRRFVHDELEHLGYRLSWRVLNASEFGVPQDRRHGVLVAMAEPAAQRFEWPVPRDEAPPTVGEALLPSMSSGEWPHATSWAAYADRIAPAVVGGSKNRGGADLGPSGTKRSWARLGVNGSSIGDTVPGPDFPWSPHGDPKLLPKLTVEQVAILQGVPSDWELVGGKTSRYRQLGHACPPPLATALGHRLAEALILGE